MSLYLNVSFKSIDYEEVLLDSFCNVLMGTFAVSTRKDSVWYRNFYRRRLTDDWRGCRRQADDEWRNHQRKRRVLDDGLSPYENTASLLFGV